MDTISGISPSTATSEIGAAAPTADQTLGKDTFLKLLVAQLRYQDPLSPADSQEFMAQTAQFTSVEKLEEIAASMATLTKNDALSTIGNLVGKSVQYRDSLGNVVEAKVTAGKVDPDGVVLVLDDDRELRIGDVEAVLAGPTAASAPTDPAPTDPAPTDPAPTDPIPTSEPGPDPTPTTPSSESETTP